VTGFNDHRILIASHIHPWQDADDDERLDVNNGILLSPTYDALFDRHLITFDNSGRIVLNDAIKPAELAKIGVVGNEQLRKLNSDNIVYLERHQRVFEAKGSAPAVSRAHHVEG
jgi:predicted restriction endonuclease